MNNVTQKTVKELAALGFDLLAFSAGSRSPESGVQSFIAKYKRLKVHAWFSISKGVYEFTIVK